MSRSLEPAPVLRLCSCLTSRPELFAEVKTGLARAFGEIALESRSFPFDSSEYYKKEMGAELRRIWYAFRELCGADLLPEARLATERIEQALSVDGKRRVNLDPGYLDLGKLVLASFKEAPDKIYLGRGVWAHTCLRFRSGCFTAPDHSFPDFRDGRFDGFLLEARALYKSLLRERQDSSR